MSREDLLQRWCRHSLRLFGLRGMETARSNKAVSDAETVIEMAAFQKLADSRKIDLSGYFGSLQIKADSDDLLRELVNSCPLSETSEVDSLGFLHEFLITQRGRLSKTSQRQTLPSRKANGIFYTPREVVDYIIDQTLGRRLSSASPTDIEQLSVLDPATGCGAFLVAAYRSLLSRYRDWYSTHQPEQSPKDIEFFDGQWRLTFNRRLSILKNNIFGMDLDASAIEVARRSLLLALLESGPSNERRGATLDQILSSNLKQSNALLGSPFELFPQIAKRGGFDIVIGNPPYRRERDFQRELELIAQTPLGQHRSPRMDLWYYFVHRGIELLCDQGTISYISNAYWMQSRGSKKLIAALRDEVRLDELFLLGDFPIFCGVSGRHTIFSATKSEPQGDILVKVLKASAKKNLMPLNLASVDSYSKSRTELFVDGGIRVHLPSATAGKNLHHHPRLGELGKIRQGIAENPSTINRRTIERFRDDPSSANWTHGEGVFSLTPDEVLKLSENELELLRPYHDLCDLGRYWSAAKPSRQLIYSTRRSCPDIERYPTLKQHLSRFRAILDARRETREGSNCWWHLHWPRDERIWQADKIVVLQMAVRPAFVPTFTPTYVPFSANVFVPNANVIEDLRYLCGLLNSRLLWEWLEQHAKHRGAGLELNGHLLQEVPIRRIDFEKPADVCLHDDLVRLVDQRMALERQRIELSSTNSEVSMTQIESCEAEIDSLVSRLYEQSAESSKIGKSRRQSLDLRG